MITTVVGRTFLQAYNEKYQSNKSPKEFFEEVYFDLFYNHSKYMQWVTNSPFVQMKSGQKPETLAPDERREKLLNLYEKAETLEPDASFALGFPAAETKEYASTSGLVSDINIPVNPDDVYLSWIGSGLGIGVAGGFSILFDDPIITLKTFEGWQIYRKYLADSTLEKLRGNQVNTWNGQWLTYSLNPDRFNEDFDFTELYTEGVFAIDNTMVEVNTIKWSELFFSLCQLYPNRELTGYVYGFGQTNKTIGFIPFFLKSGTRIIEVYQKLFDNADTDKRRFEALFGIHIKRACELGSIGLQALRPDGITKYMQDGKNLSFKKDDELLNYYAYKTWLTTMLTKNKEEVTDYTSQLAEVILRYRKGSKGMERPTLINKELFASKNKKGFIEALVTMIGGLDDEDLRMIKKLRDDVHLMTNEEFGYFSTLLKFDYAYQEKNS